MAMETVLYVNVERREFLDPRGLGDGSEMIDTVWANTAGAASALALLGLVPAARDQQVVRGEAAEAVVGRWWGERVVMLTEHTAGMVPGLEGVDAHSLWETCAGRVGQGEGDGWRDVTPLARAALGAVLPVRYVRQGVDWVYQRHWGDEDSA